MKLKKYVEYLKMGKEALDNLTAPLRANQTKKLGEIEQLKIDEKIMNLENEIQDIVTKHPLNFNSLISKLDEVALLERRKKQFGAILNDLFPE